MDKQTKQIAWISATLLLICILVASQTILDTLINGIAWGVGLISAWVLIMAILIRKW